MKVIWSIHFIIIFLNTSGKRKSNVIKNRKPDPSIGPDPEVPQD